MSQVHDYKDEYVWIDPEKPGEFCVSIGAKIITSDAGEILLQDDDGREKWIEEGALLLRHMHVTSVEGVEDMIGLGDLNESSIVRNLFTRYMKHQIYTYTGSILVSVNPYQVLPIYTEDQVHLYQEKKIGELPPHVFAIAANAYSSLKRYQKDQCIIISGESGSGKTECTKLILEYLASVSGQNSGIEKQILQANPIIEAFGNAKTIRNDNSSRFGKYIDIHFNEKGVIEGARIEQYLLEKSRIVSQRNGERNYHIFYCMLAGMTLEEKSIFELREAEYYDYLVQGKSIECDGRTDNKDFSGILSAMKVLMFEEDDIMNILKVLSSLLQLGNIKFIETELDNIAASEIEDIIFINKASKLMEVDAQALIDALTTKTISAKDDMVTYTMSKSQAVDVRDAFVKGIYGRMFIWIVEKINNTIFKPQEHWNRKSIRVLDIFSFENFDQNSFEQFCINYAVESLQQFFVKHIFKFEQTEYNTEGINWKHIEFVDNQDVLDLIADKPMNILALLDEESKFPKGTDESMLNKLHRYHANHPKYQKPKSTASQTFSIQHFAGLVVYDSKGFLDKNRDTFSSDLVQLIQASKNNFIKSLFNSIFSMDNERKKTQTLASQFKKSLELLMATLNACQPYFIRCIKPNEFKKPLVFDRELCCKQLRYLGMMETIRIRQGGYPIRHRFAEFVDRYRCLVSGVGPSVKGNCKASCTKICSNFLKSSDFQLGKSKVFLKGTADLCLEHEREVILTKNILILQKSVQCWLCRKRYFKMKKGFTLLQATFRSKRLNKSWRTIQKWVVDLQSVCRGYMVRRNLQNQQISKPVRIKQQLSSSVGSDTMHETKNVEKISDRLTINPSVKEKDSLKEEEKESVKDEENDSVQEAKNGSLSAPDVNDTEDKHQVTQTQEVPSVTAMKNVHPMIDTTDENTFSNFAAKNFQWEVTPSHSIELLTQPLLALSSEADQLAALAIWIVILRFMTDLPEPKNTLTRTSSNNETPTMTKIASNLSQKFSKKDVQKAVRLTKAKIAGEANLPETSNFFKPSNMDESPDSTDESDTDTSDDENDSAFRKLSYAGYDSRKHSVITLPKTSGKRSEKDLDTISDIIGGDINTTQHSNGTVTSLEIHNPLLEDRRMSSFEKLQYIIGHCILRSDLRDEIYCQICKQLTNNNSNISAARGWILLSLCACSFLPSDKLLPCLLNFLQTSNIQQGSFCEKLLRRTLVNGVRTSPPGWTEIKAVSARKPISLEVILMDANPCAVEIDSATTATELCLQLSDHIGLKDKFGFSLFIALLNRISKIDSDDDHVMDVVAQSEQYAAQLGCEEKDAPWRLYFRKEIFTPWHNPSADPIATDLIYHQIIIGIKSGEYSLEKDQDLAMFAAQHYFIQHGVKVVIKKLEELVPLIIPDSMLDEEGSVKVWINTIVNKLRDQYFQNPKVESLKIKEDIVSYAMFKWPLLFSRFYQVYTISGPNMPDEEVIIAVNWTGVYVVNEAEDVLLELSYPEIISITSVRTKVQKQEQGRQPGQSISILTINDEEYIVYLPYADDLKKLVQLFLKGLKERSKYAVAIRDSKNTDPTKLFLKKGDFVLLDRPTGESPLPSSALCSGHNVNTGKKGSFTLDSISIVPALTKPPVEIMNMVTKWAKLYKEKEITREVFADFHTLEEFATGNFRPSSKRNVAHGQEKWRHSKKPLKHPLLKRLVGQEQLSLQACKSYVGIMKYMGDYPSKKARTASVFFTDQIFTGPVNDELLRDEFYCQMMKQLTDNKNSVSEERGWELMWMATGCISPSPDLLKELITFLMTRCHISLAAECLGRLQLCLSKGVRKSPPHILEVNAIQQKTLKISQRVNFPNNRNEIYDIHSSSTAGDLCQEICKKLNIKSFEGFSVFLQANDKMLSIPEEEFFFDWLHMSSLESASKGKKQPKKGSTPSTGCEVFFMKNIWIEIEPGEDTQADLLFHYYQTLPYYLKSFYKCTLEEATQLGALVYRIQYGEDEANFNNISKILKQLIPSDLIEVQKAKVWKQDILAEYHKNEGKSDSLCKVDFLKIISKNTTYGSDFFEVKQTSDSSLPSDLIIAINENGFHLLHNETKNLLARYPFSKITHWKSDDTFFHMSLGGDLSDEFKCKTAMGYRVADLLKSYIKLIS